MNAVHLDFKGAIPGLPKLKEWLLFWRNCGYDSVVMEYDDRLEWRTFPGLRRGGLTPDEHHELIDYCRIIGLEIIPLIQVLGHLEWLLKHPEYEFLREDGHLTELCPSQPETAGLIKKWIDEVIDLHPGCRYIHLGADETWNIGSCAKCREHAAADSRGRLGLYIDHVGAMCRHALSRKVRPLIWADMFIHDDKMELVSLLPQETVLVDWQYTQCAPYKTTAELAASGREVWGAAGALIGYYEHCSRIMGEPGSRIDNCIAWTEELRRGGVGGVIHTAWGRGASLWSIYGAWHGAYPAFIAGGCPERWRRHPWHDFFCEMGNVMTCNTPPELERAADEVLRLPAATGLEREVLRYCNLALRYQNIQSLLYIERCAAAVTAESARFVWRERRAGETYFKWNFAGIADKLDAWEKEAVQFWRDNTLSDAEEFFAARCNTVRKEISQAAEIK